MRCPHPYCGGNLFAEPATDAFVGPHDQHGNQLVCSLCGRSTGEIDAPLPLVRSHRLQPIYAKRLAEWNRELNRVAPE